MRRSLLVGLCVVVALVVASPALADTLSKTVAALKQSPVYVEPGTPGATVDTAGELKGQLINGDNIVIVMLVPGSISGDLTGFAQQVNSKMGGKKIVGISAGDQEVAYSSLLPAGVAADLMHRAASISVGGSDTLKTFIRYTHSWQQQHPQEPASKPVDKHAKKGGFPVLIVLLLVIGLVVVLGGVIFARSNRATDADHVSFDKSPPAVRSPLEKIQGLKHQVEDPELQQQLTLTCRYTEDYFSRSTGNAGADSRVFQSHLSDIADVLEKYIDVQNQPQYYENPQDEMRKGSDAVTGFNAFVLKSIRRGSSTKLTDYKVKTDILSAQRWA